MTPQQIIDSATKIKKYYWNRFKDGACQEWLQKKAMADVLIDIFENINEENFLEKGNHER